MFSILLALAKSVPSIKFTVSTYPFSSKYTSTFTAFSSV